MPNQMTATAHRSYSESASEAKMVWEEANHPLPKTNLVKELTCGLSMIPLLAN